MEAKRGIVIEFKEMLKEKKRDSEEVKPAVKK